MKEIDKIKQKCKEAGLGIYDVLREAKVPRDTVQNWNKKNPKAFETKDKIYAAIDKLSNDVLPEETGI